MRALYNNPGWLILSLPDSHWYHVDGGIQNTEPASNTLVIPALNRKERNSFGDNSRQSVVALILLVILRYVITLVNYNIWKIMDTVVYDTSSMLIHPHPTRVYLPCADTSKAVRVCA